MPEATTYTALQPPQEEGRHEPVTVLVTGFGPFLAKVPINSSWEIASRLPALLPATPSHPTPVHIRVHHEPIRVSYQTVVDLIPKLLPSSPSPSSANATTTDQSPPQHHSQPDIILHIGLAASRPYYTLERGSHALGYGRLKDVDSALFPDSEAERKFLSSTPPLPLRLETSFDTNDVLYRWRSTLGYTDPTSDPSSISNSHPQHNTTTTASSSSNNNAAKNAELPPYPLPDVRISSDAGNFMCGFIYFNSLAHYHYHHRRRHAASLNDNKNTNNHQRPVVFLHVPDLSKSTEKLEQGREVTIALIRALVASWREKGGVDDMSSSSSTMTTTVYAAGVEREQREQKEGRERTGGTMDVNFLS